MIVSLMSHSLYLIDFIYYSLIQKIKRMDIRNKVNRYRKQLRKEEIHKFMSCERKKMMDNYTLSQLSLQLTNNPSHSFQTLLEMFWDSFLDPFQMKNHSKVISTELQIYFWKEFLLNPTHSQITCDSLVLFVLNFIKINSWKDINKIEEYAVLLVEVIEIVLGDLENDDKKNIVEWIADLDMSSFLKRILRMNGYFSHP